MHLQLKGSIIWDAFTMEKGKIAQICALTISGILALDSMKNCGGQLASSCCGVALPHIDREAS